MAICVSASPAGDGPVTCSRARDSNTPGSFEWYIHAAARPIANPRMAPRLVHCLRWPGFGSSDRGETTTVTDCSGGAADISEMAAGASVGGTIGCCAVIGTASGRGSGCFGASDGGGGGGTGEKDVNENGGRATGHPFNADHGAVSPFSAQSGEFQGESTRGGAKTLPTLPVGQSARFSREAECARVCQPFLVIQEVGVGHSPTYKVPRRSGCARRFSTPRIVGEADRAS